MAKNTFAIIGILAVLLLGIGMVSAVDYVQDVTLKVVGDGVTGDRLTRVNDSSNIFTVNFTNNNASLGDVYVNWSVGTETDMNLADSIIVSVGESNISGNFDLTMPYKASSYVRLTAHIYDNSDRSIEYGTKYVNVYYNNTDYVASTDIPGCTDSTANNYDSSATVDDGSCTYDPTPSTSTTFCELETYTDQGDLEISDFDINNFGKGDDEEWQYLDEIEIKIEIENTNDDDDVDDVEVEIRIFDDKIENGGNDITNDFDLKDEISDDIGTLKDGDEETLTFTINKVSPDLDDGTYYLYLMAYEDGNKENQCISESSKLDDDYYFQFSIESVDDDEAVVARDVGLDSIIDTYCDQKNLEISIPIYNLGDNDEEKVLVNIYNSEMEINEYVVINDLDSGDDETAVFIIDIPSSLSKDKYDLDITIYFDWDDDENEENIFAYDEDTSDEIVRLNILGCAGLEPSINANLESAAEVGTNLVVKALVTNNGNDNDFAISVSNFESWADLVSVSPQTTSIDEGEFAEVTITFKPKIAGAQSFKINTIADGESYDQSVSVNIAEKPGIFSGMSDIVTYTIIGIIAVLVLIFLVLIAKISRRPAKPQF